MQNKENIPVLTKKNESKRVNMTKDNNNHKISNDGEVLDHYVDPTPYKLSKTNQILLDVLKTIVIPVVLSILWNYHL